MKKQLLFEKIFKKQYLLFIGYALKYLPRLSMAQDLVQETFIHVWNMEREFDDEKHLEGYIFKSIKNGSLNLLKNRKFKCFECYNIPIELHFLKDNIEIPKIIIEEDTFTDPVFGVENQREFIIKEINIAIKNLPDKMQTVIKLSKKGLTVDEVAEKMGIARNTVKDHKKVGYKKLKTALRHLENYA